MVTDQQDESAWRGAAKGWGVFFLLFIGWGVIMTESQQIAFGTMLMSIALMFFIRMGDGNF